MSKRKLWSTCLLVINIQPWKTFAWYSKNEEKTETKADKLFQKPFNNIFFSNVDSSKGDNSISFNFYLSKSVRVSFNRRCSNKVFFNKLSRAGHGETFSVSTKDKNAMTSLNNKTIEAVNCSTHRNIMIDVNPYPLTSFMNAVHKGFIAMFSLTYFYC